MKILTVVGNRPQFIKAAVVSGLLRQEHDEVLVHTGQHHDESLSQVFFSELGLLEPERQLQIAGGSNTSQMARMLAALEPLIAELAPDATLVYGDTNSTLAGALACAQAGVPVIHVEAGMRSFDRTMPEELNRVLTDHLGDLLLCSSQTAADNLSAESVAGEVQIVGDVMVDLALRRLADARQAAAQHADAQLADAQLADAQTLAQQAVPDVLAAHRLERGAYLLISAHRAGNVDVPERLARLVELIAALPLPAVFPVHPRTRARLRESGLEQRLAGLGHVEVVDPIGYGEFAALLHGARAVLTDSGGVQKEAYIAGVPCITLRPNTEWVETVDAGWNTLVDLDANATAGALAALAKDPPAERPPLYGEGDAAQRCVAAIGAWGECRGHTFKI